MFVPRPWFPRRALVASAALALAVPILSPMPAPADPLDVVGAPTPEPPTTLLGRLAPAVGAPTYHPPVDAPVIDPFRPPPVRWAAGHRGLLYATVPGTPVLAVGPGVVTFAGAVAGTLWVTVQHPDGIRTSTSLASIAVVRGQAVTGSTVIGLAGPRLHLGARRGDTYIDPASLWGQRSGPPRVILVPLDGHGPRALPPPATWPSAPLAHWAGPGGIATLVRWPTPGEPIPPPPLPSIRRSPSR